MLFTTYQFLLRLHSIIAKDIVDIYQYFFGKKKLLGEVLNKGSTKMLENTSMSLPFVEELSSKVRIFEDKSKSLDKIIFKSEPVSSGLSLIVVHPQQQSWIDSLDSESIMDLLHTIHQAKANSLNQGFIRYALNVLSERVKRGNQSASPLYLKDTGFELPNAA